MEGEPILKKTLVTMGAMVGACVVFVGTLSVAAVIVTSHAVGSGGASASSEPAVVPAEKIDAQSARPATGAKPAVPLKTARERI
jgi:hypothetical protein